MPPIIVIIVCGRIQMKPQLTQMVRQETHEKHCKTNTHKKTYTILCTNTTWIHSVHWREYRTVFSCISVFVQIVY